MDDPQIPDSLEVSQNTQFTTSAAVRRGVGIGVGVVWMAGVGVAGTIWMLRSMV